MAGKNIDFKNNITKRIKGQAVCNPTNIPSEFRSEFLKISIAVRQENLKNTKIEANFGYGFVFSYLRPIFRVFFLIICRWQWNSSEIPSGIATQNRSEKQPASPKGSFATFLSNNWPEDSTS